MEKNLYQKLNDIQKKVTSVFKGSRVSMGSGNTYSAVSHDDVAALLHLPMAEAGVFTEVSVIDCDIQQIITEKEYQGKVDKKYSYMAKIKVQVTFVNSDKPEDRFVCYSSAYAFDSGDKAVGKAESMAVKYVYLKNFVLESTDDEESRDFEKPHQYDQRQSNYQAPPQNQNLGQNNHQSMVASDAQKGLMKRLGITFNENISKQEAMKLIGEHNKGK